MMGRELSYLGSWNYWPLAIVLNLNDVYIWQTDYHNYYSPSSIIFYLFLIIILHHLIKEIHRVDYNGNVNIETMFQL